jgi:hypothetical protein
MIPGHRNLVEVVRKAWFVGNATRVYVRGVADCIWICRRREQRVQKQEQQKFIGNPAK